MNITKVVGEHRGRLLVAESWTSPHDQATKVMVGVEDQHKEGVTHQETFPRDRLGSAVCWLCGKLYGTVEEFREMPNPSKAYHDVVRFLTPLFVD